MKDAETIIKHLKLQAHPEGGYFRETYRSNGEIGANTLGAGYNGKRNYSTCIYFLLTSGKPSLFHKIRQDEVWHFYTGAPLVLHEITPGGGYVKTLIGNELAAGETPQYVVQGGNWFAAEVAGDNAFSLLGCTVAPGFDFSDFELARRNGLTRQFPDHAKVIKKFTTLVETS